MSKAVRKIGKALRDSLSTELAIVFPGRKKITVSDSFAGYSNDQHEKVVLGVEVQDGPRYQTHIVKLGTRDTIGNDFNGWRNCIAGRQFCSRIFVTVELHELAKRKRKQGTDRVAVVYQDAYQFYGESPSDHSPQSLDIAVEWAVLDNKPDSVSVERVVRQIFSDLNRWFYYEARQAPDACRRFYERRLAVRGRPLEAINRWDADEYRRSLRRDATWLLCGGDKPDSDTAPAYVDPHDCLTWFLRRPDDQLPATLVGNSHGDLHGRNILVGIHRGEAEYPAVYDYGEMSQANVLVWDFVKLETELKVRLFKKLLENEETRRSLRDRAAFPKFLKQQLDESVTSNGAKGLFSLEQLACGFCLEAELAELTRKINDEATVNSLDPPGGRQITGNDKIDHALAILLRIRQEAALWLGQHPGHRGKHNQWRDEYYFGLAAYCVGSSKYSYDPFETRFALVSGGVAAAQISIVNDTCRTAGSRRHARADDCPSYQPVLRDAYRLWRTGETRKLKSALSLLESATQRFPTAMPLLRERCLVSTALGEFQTSQKLLEHLRHDCRRFGDVETLCRIGNTYKKQADAAWDAEPRHPPMDDNNNHPAQQWYRSAFECYAEAFEFSHDHYPGVNAAFLALLLGKKEKAHELAREVLSICGRTSLGGLPGDEAYWVLSSEGTAALVVNDSQQAVSFFRQALALLGSDTGGLAEISRASLVRLGRVLDSATLSPVMKLFKSNPKRV